ncbi:MAG: glycosyltransferase family 4 protein [Anaerolineae bacterium]|jgi:glycosyltransferase involved in cell wall biosynthesis
MRIVFLLTQDLESPSGLGRYWPIGKELTRLGHEITILALHSNYESLEEHEKDFIREGVHVRYVGQMHVRKVGSHKTYFSSIHLLQVALLGSLKLARAALQAPADAYHVGKPHPMNSLAGLLASRLRGRPLYLDCDDYESASNRFGGTWQRWIVSLFENKMPQMSKRITTNTVFTVHRLSELGVPKDRIVYVPNGVERSRFSHILDDDVEKLRGQLNLAGKKTILYLGSMSLANHAIDLLLEGFVVVREVESTAELLLVGGGEDYDALRAQAKALGIEDAVHFTGRVLPSRAPLYYALADVSVDPVRDDPASRARHPLKLVESLACGTPVVTGNVGDRSRILGDASAGLVAAPGDATSLAKAILRVLRDRKSAYERQCGDRDLDESLYWDQLVKDFARAYAAP